MVGIYMIQNKVNYKVYIGQSWNIRERLNEHKRELSLNVHFNRHLQSAWNKYGSDNFIFTVICDLTWLNNLEKEHAQSILDSAEILWINYFGGENSSLTYNFKSGGGGGTYSNEYKKWLSDNRKGKFMGKNNSMFGKHHTQSTKEKISRNRKGKNVGEDNHLYGKPLSDEIKRKIGDANRGRVQTNEEKEKRKISMQKLRDDPAYNLKMKEVAKCNGLKNRKYNDDFVLKLRRMHSGGMSIKAISKQENIPFESCRQMINGINRFGGV